MPLDRQHAKVQALWYGSVTFCCPSVSGLHELPSPTLWEEGQKDNSGTGSQVYSSPLTSV